MVTGPQTQCPALVHFDATHAAFTGIFSKEKLRLAACRLWPQHLGFAQECTGEAALFRSARPPEEARAVEPGMHCLVVCATTAPYWLIHALCYSHYPFRAQWMQPMGYSEAQVRQMVLLSVPSVPQLVTVVWSLSFTVLLACCVAHSKAIGWIIVHTRQRGAIRGPRPVFSLRFPPLGGNGRDHLYLASPIDLIGIHGPSTLIASLVAGAILGACRKGRILPALDCVQPSAKLPICEIRGGSISPLRRNPMPSGV